ncbi:MAG: reverse transcriptase family protein [Candidatus Gastranaerophilales bacterium]|nr:reverse transcriptase family protein [Candidatus Gastranaerophilales bacterium]
MKKVFVNSQMFYEVYETKDRTIYAPCDILRQQQKHILSCIKMVYNLSLNTKNAARVHCGRKWLLKTDIKSFYDSFSKEQIIRGIKELCENLRTEYKTELDEENVYELCTLNGKLPTGALTSAHLANLAFKITKIDEVICEFCRQNKVNYSRYMDDMTFSADNKSLLQETEEFVRNLLAHNNFSLNDEKTKYISGNKRQEVLGVLVNNKNTAISKLNKHKIRAVIFRYLKSLYIEERLGVNVLFVKKTGFNVITGYMSYLKDTDPKYYEKMKSYIANKSHYLCLDYSDEIIKLKKLLKIEDKQLKLFD